MIVKIDYRIVFNDLERQIGRYGIDFINLNNYNDVACRTYDIFKELSMIENINPESGIAKLESIYVNSGNTFKKVFKNCKL